MPVSNASALLSPQYLTKLDCGPPKSAIDVATAPNQQLRFVIMSPEDVVPVYTAIIVLLLTITYTTLTPKVTWHYLWQVTPALLFLYMIGFFVWVCIVIGIHTGILFFSVPMQQGFAQTGAFVLFTLAILWTYFQQLRVLVDVFLDFELMRSVAWAHRYWREFRQPPADGGHGGDELEEEVIGGNCFLPMHAWPAILKALRASLHRSKPRFIVELPGYIVVMAFSSSVMALGFLSRPALAWITRRGATIPELAGPLQELLSFHLDITTEMPQCQLWSLWRLSTSLDDGRSAELLTHMTHTPHLTAARRAATRRIDREGIIDRSNPSNKELVLTVVLVLINNPRLIDDVPMVGLTVEGVSERHHTKSWLRRLWSYGNGHENV